MALSSADASPGTYWAVFDWVLGVRPPQEQRVDPTPTPGTLLSTLSLLVTISLFSMSLSIFCFHSLNGHEFEQTL